MEGVPRDSIGDILDDVDKAIERLNAQSFRSRLGLLESWVEFASDEDLTRMQQRLGGLEQKKLRAMGRKARSAVLKLQQEILAKISSTLQSTLQ